MIKLGRYSFYGVTHINISDIKYEDGLINYFIQPDVNPDGWWVTSYKMEQIFIDFNLTYIEPYIPIKPKPYLREFRF